MKSQTFKRADMGAGLSINSKIPAKLKKHSKYLSLYLLVLPVIVYYAVFHYLPMYGAVIAFKDFSPGKGIWGSPWIGFDWFIDFFKSIYFTKLLKNTLLLSIYSIIWAFPIPIIFALALNELRDGVFKRLVQSMSYLPHFISTVVIVGIVMDILSPKTGLVNVILASLGVNQVEFLLDPRCFRSVYIFSSIWKDFGWGSIIYLATLSSTDVNLYDAASIDGANRWQKMLHITIPVLVPVITIMLILRIGSALSVDFEKVLLLQNPATYETSDVIATYTYRRGILEGQFSFSTAVGLFNSVVNFILLYVSNKISKRMGEVSLW